MGKNKDAGSDAAAAANVGISKGIKELRRQFDVTQENIAPFLTAGTEALPELQRASTAKGLNERLMEIMSGERFSALSNERERAVRGQLAGAGLNRSGTALEAIAAVPTDIALALEQTLTGRLGNLVGSGQNAASNLGALGAQNAGSIASLFAQQGQNTGSGIISDAQAASAGIGSLLSGIGSIAGAATKAGGLGALASGIFFSDPRLKENVEEIARIGDIGLYQWDWIPEIKEMELLDSPPIGFMADEVECVHPELVGEFLGFKVIDYEGVFEELEAA